MTANITKTRKQKSAVCSKKNRPTQNTTALLNEYCKDLQDWPNSWAGSGQDIQIGKSLVEEFKLLLLDRIKNGRAKSTVKIYAGYLWALGGELIRQINQYENERKLSARQLILKYVSLDGGPYWCHARDQLDHEKYDSVCRQLFKILSASTTSNP
jgi:hypothetical protein